MTAAQWAFAVMAFVVVLTAFIALLWEHEATQAQVELDAERADHERTRIALQEAYGLLELAADNDPLTRRRAQRAQRAQIVRLPGGAS